MVTDVEQPMTEAGLMAQRPPLSGVLGAWQPMKTAPKDGTSVLALLDGSDIPYAMRWLLADDPRGSGKDGWHITWDGARLSDRFPVRYWMRCPPDPDAGNAIAPNQEEGRSMDFCASCIRFALMANYRALHSIFGESRSTPKE